MAKAQLISGAKFYYADGDGTDTEPVTWTVLDDVITELPEFFSKPDTVDTTTINNTTQTNIASLSGGDSLDFGVLLNDALYTAHAAMKASQDDEAKGDSWFKIEFSAPISRKMTWRGSVSDNVVIAGGAAADLLAGTLPVYPSTDIVEAAIS